jgi:thiol-disulfide isomerase/thioredoxin
MEEKKLCSKCGSTKKVDEFYFKKTENRFNSWCKKCVYELQIQRWIDRKKKAVNLFGGKCSVCGYSKNYAALDFHHIDPSTKEADWASMRLKKWSDVVDELKKCCLVCKNCHSEIHNPYAVMDSDSAENSDNKYLNATVTPTGVCPTCDSEVYGTIYCSVACNSVSRRKVERPTFEELKKLIEEKSFCAIAREHKVSDNAVRKWAKNYGLI